MPKQDSSENSSTHEKTAQTQRKPSQSRIVKPDIKESDKEPASYGNYLLLITIVVLLFTVPPILLCFSTSASATVLIFILLMTALSGIAYFGGKLSV